MIRPIRVTFTGEQAVTEKLNPYQPPQTAAQKKRSKKRADKHLAFWDWLSAVSLGVAALCSTFLTVGVATSVSLIASNYYRLVTQNDELDQIGLFLCFSLSLATGYSASANYLAHRLRQSRASSEDQGNTIQLRPSRLETVLGKTVVLDKLLVGCFSGLFSALMLAPFACVLISMLCRTLRLSQDQSYWAMLSTFIGSMVVGLLIGWYRWRRVNIR